MRLAHRNAERLRWLADAASALAPEHGRDASEVYERLAASNLLRLVHTADDAARMVLRDLLEEVQRP